MKDDIKISVICATYNHAGFVRQCLQSFADQKTDFAFEVIVHDDASTDDTQAIIREYCDRYPSLFVPILQTQNQVSQGISPTRRHMIPIVRGKYVAICEGDDCWTDCTKLQKQYDFLEAHPEYSACVHNALLHNMSDSRQDYIFPGVTEDRDYSLEEVILGDGGLFSTNSLVAKKEVFTAMPEAFLAKGFMDYQWFMHSAIMGKVRCLKDVMSQYNFGTNGSWTQRMRKNPQKRIEHFKEKERMLLAVDSYYQGAYHEAIMKKADEVRFRIYYLEGNKEALKKEPYKSMKKLRIALFLQTKMPWLYGIVRFFYDKLTHKAKL